MNTVEITLISWVVALLVVCIALMVWNRDLVRQRQMYRDELRRIRQNPIGQIKEMSLGPDGLSLVGEIYKDLPKAKDTDEYQKPFPDRWDQ